MGVAVAAACAAVGTVVVTSQAHAGEAAIVGAGSGRCIDVPNFKTTNGTRVQLYDCNNGTNQAVTSTSSGQLQVLGKCLDAYGWGRAQGTAVVLWDCNGGANQKWTVNSNGSITGVDSGLCLDATGAATTDGTPLQLWGCNSQSNQRWNGAVGSGSTGGSGGSSGSGKGLHVSGRNLVDGNGQVVVFRGIEDVIRWGAYSGTTPWGDVPWEGGTNDAYGNQIPEIAKTGANTVRILGGMPDELDGILYKAIVQQHMWVSVDRVDWRNATVIATLKKYANYITLEPKGESLETDETSWRNDSIYVIQQMRALGYTSPIEIYANGYGQTGQTVLDQGDAVFNADPLKDTVFGYQLYSEYANDVNGWLDKTAAFDHPIFVGACLFTSTYGNNPDTYKQVWEGTASRGLNGFYWAWSGDGDGNNMSSNGSYNSLTGIGQYLVNQSWAKYSTSVKTSYLLHAFQ